MSSGSTDRIIEFPDANELFLGLNFVLDLSADGLIIEKRGNPTGVDGLPNRLPDVCSRGMGNN
jgi:hypothetical protein